MDGYDHLQGFHFSCFRPYFNTWPRGLVLTVYSSRHGGVSISISALIQYKDCRSVWDWGLLEAFDLF